MPPATQQPTNKTAVYAARRALHQPSYRTHAAYKRRERPVSSNVYKRPDTNPAFRDDIIDKRCDNTSFDVCKRSDHEAYPSVVSKVPYCCW